MLETTLIVIGCIVTFGAGWVIGYLNPPRRLFGFIVLLVSGALFCKYEPHNIPMFACFLTGAALHFFRIMKTIEKK